MRDCLRNDLADKVSRAATPKRAKDMAAEIDPHDLDMWHKSNGHKVVWLKYYLQRHAVIVFFYYTGNFY